MEEPRTSRQLLTTTTAHNLPHTAPTYADLRSRQVPVPFQYSPSKKASSIVSRIVIHSSSLPLSLASFALTTIPTLPKTHRLQKVSDRDQVKSAMVDLTTLLQSNYDENRKLCAKLREKFSNLMITGTNAVRLLSDTSAGPSTKKRKTTDDLTMSLIVTDDLTKAEVALHLVDATRGIHIIPFHNSRGHVQFRHCTMRWYGNANNHDTGTGNVQEQTS